MWWEKLIDKGTGIFKVWVDYDSAKNEANAAQRYEVVSSANAAEVQAANTGDFLGVPPLVIAGAALLAAFFILRK